MNRLEAWLEGHHAGAFVWDDEDRVSFEYAQDAPATPVSLSLPRDATHAKRAAGRFLANLLPDHKTARSRMATAYGAASTDTFDLLSAAGGDVAGGLVLTPEGDEPGTGRVDFLAAQARDIAGRIEALKQDADAWVPDDVPARFSLAGTQGKFALARVGSEWFWSHGGLPSTHIVKPANPRLPELEGLEADSLGLAQASGITASEAEVLDVGGATAFIVKRFDREVQETGIARRLHVEDFAQAMGVDSARKYEPSAIQIIRMLKTANSNHELAYGFVRQFAFNTILSNADAHSKNYSLMLRPDHVDLAPLYDTIPIGVYPEYDQHLAMKVSHASRPQQASPDHWRKLAVRSGIQPDRVVTEVASIARNMEEQNATAWKQVSAQLRDRVRAIIERNAAVVQGRPKH